MLLVLYIWDLTGGQPLSCAVDRYPHLTKHNLHVADLPVDTKDLNNDALIGANNYWRPVKGEVV